MTETREYRTRDKSDWERGPWDDEPDKKQWRDEATGLPCLIVRNELGALCGYVGVSSDHPWHGKDYGDLESYPEVHGGLTFTGGCGHSGDETKGICHVPSPGEPDDVWWFGFDCAHCGDRSYMSLPSEIRKRNPGLYQDGIYRDVAYVESEVAGLARQLAEVVA